MLGAHIAVAHLRRRGNGELDDALGARGQALRRGGVRRAEADERLDLLLNGLARNAEVAEHLGGHAAALQNQAVEQMLRPDIAVSHAARRLLRKLEGVRRTVGEFILIKHMRSLPSEA